MLKFMPLMVVVPIAVLLCLSFFVLYVMRKIDGKALKLFGAVVVALLWLSALVLFSGVIVKATYGSMRGKDMMHQKRKMECVSRMMRNNRPLAMSMPVREQASLDAKRPAMPKRGGNKGIVYKAE